MDPQAPQAQAPQAQAPESPPSVEVSRGIETPPISRSGVHSGAPIVARAQELGFDAVGIARADVPLDADFARYEAFIADGKHGEMGWMVDPSEIRRRVDTSAILEGARSVICLARSYARSDASEQEDPATARMVARYARGRDYHNGLRKKLRKLAAYVRTLAPGAQARPLCDEEPILERAWAARAGLGFVGKNGLLIVPGTGSFVLLGEVVTTLAIEPSAPIPERCGSCRLCLDACPTDAFVAPFVLDPRRCIAYLTIEQRTQPIEAELAVGLGPDHLFGCDDCQTVCPFNRKGRNVAQRGDTDARFVPDGRWQLSLEDLLFLDEAGFDRLRQGSPVGRATREGLARNAAVLLGNRGDEAALSALERAKTTHEHPLVREAAARALLARGR